MSSDHIPVQCPALGPYFCLAWCPDRADPCVSQDSLMSSCRACNWERVNRRLLKVFITFYFLICRVGKKVCFLKFYYYSLSFNIHFIHPMWHSIAMITEVVNCTKGLAKEENRGWPPAWAPLTKTLCTGTRLFLCPRSKGYLFSTTGLPSMSPHHSIHPEVVPFPNSHWSIFLFRNVFLKL